MDSKIIILCDTFETWDVVRNWDGDKKILDHQNNIWKIQVINSGRYT